MRLSVWPGLFLFLVLMVGCNGASGPELLNQGIAALNQKQYDDAITLLKKATDRMPKSAEAYNYLGAAYQGKGEQTLAVRQFERSISLNPKYPPARFNLGVMCYERQQFGKAIENLNVFVALQPNNVEGYFYLASAQFQAEELRDAWENYNKVVTLDASRPEVLNNLGVISAKIHMNDPREAETMFKACINTDPKYSPAYLNIAILYHHTLNKPAAALDYYQRFLELEPAGPASEKAKAAVVQLKQTVPAPARTEETKLSQTVAQVPKVTDASEETPPARTTATEPPKPTLSTPPAATTNVTAAVQPSPKVEVPAIATPTLPGPRWTMKAIAKATPGKRDAAMAQFNRAAQAQQVGQLDQAIYGYREAIKLDPTLAAAQYNLGTALQAQSMANQAIEAYLHAINLQPNFTNARLNLAILFEAQGYVADAADQYEAILRTAPNDANAHMALGRLYAAQASTRESGRQHYQRFVELAPNSTEAKNVQHLLQQMK